MKELLNWLMKAKIKIAIWATPLILLFYFDDKIHLRDRVYYFFVVFFKSIPLLLLYSYFSSDERSVLFYTGVGVVLLIDMLVGMWYHYIAGDFSFEELFKDTIKKIAIISCVYISLFILKIPLSESEMGKMFAISIQIMTLMYPVSSIAKNAFVLSDGRFPPKFFMRALYNYEKSGKLKPFFEQTSKGEMPDDLDNNVKTEEWHQKNL
jgi:hypothetical protein|nr:MAG TPA: holin [Caudoviricetes sp.]